MTEVIHLSDPDFVELYSAALAKTDPEEARQFLAMSARMELLEAGRRAIGRPHACADCALQRIIDGSRCIECIKLEIMANTPRGIFISADDIVEPKREPIMFSWWEEGF